MEGVWADLLWFGASICIRYTKLYQKSTNFEIVRAGCDQCAYVCGSGMLIAMSDAHVHHFRMRAEHARDCVTGWGWGTRT